MKGEFHDERYDGQRDDVGHGDYGPYWHRRGCSRNRGAGQISVLPLMKVSLGGKQPVPKRE